MKTIDTICNKYGEKGMSMEEYKAKRIEARIEKKLLKSEKDYKNGRVRKAEEVFKEWEAKYGI